MTQRTENTYLTKLSSKMLSSSLALTTLRPLAVGFPITLPDFIVSATHHSNVHPRALQTCPTEPLPLTHRLSLKQPHVLVKSLNSFTKSHPSKTQIVLTQIISNCHHPHTLGQSL